MPRRPRPQTTVPQAEQFRRIVDMHLQDAEGAGRPPSRPLWDELAEPAQMAVVEVAASERGIPAWQGWIVGQPQDEADQLIGAVRATLAGHASELLGWTEAVR
ncbi:hypothetical protein [Serinicoccus kebangsaanensis]|uniref:hypothetical protein n=1 Tax=Serinicoccus kebangsaanensis TaxID=2602069 RepID=UPI00124EFFDC|nr:hypothetical protein [Serinicoccus kebangsaanensis]